MTNRRMNRTSREVFGSIAVLIAVVMGAAGQANASGNPNSAVASWTRTITPPALTGLRVWLSNSNPSYNEAVTLTAMAQPAGATFTGTISFYEDPGALISTPANGVNGILLGQVSVTNQKWAQFVQPGFLGGQHTIEAIFSGSDSTLTSAIVPLNITAAIAVPVPGSAYLGAGAGGSPGSNTIGNPSIDTIEEPLTTGTGSYGIGRPYTLSIKYYSGKGNFTPFNQLAGELQGGLGGTFVPDPGLADDLQNGRIPSISWQCDSTYVPGTYSGADAAIAAWDDTEGDITTIRETAQALKQYGAPVMLRLNWEFNIFSAGRGTCAGVGANGPWTQQGYNNFIGAWQTIWQIFQQEGATNVVFDWNPGSYKEGTAFSGQVKSDPRPFYPGDTFVDWIGVDSYQDSNWTWGFSDVIDNQNGLRGSWYDDFRSHNKPMMIGEIGAQNMSYDCKTSQGFPQPPGTEVQGPFITSIKMAFDNNAYPLLHAVEWFDECSSLLDYGDSGYADPKGITAMQALGADPVTFQAGLLASAPLPTSNNWSFFKYSMPLSLSNTGLIPLTSVSVTSISNVHVIDGIGRVIPPAGPISFPNFLGYSNLEAGQTATATANFNWPVTAACVQMTINYSALQSDDAGGTKPYTGSNTIKVARFPGATCQ